MDDPLGAAPVPNEEEASAPVPDPFQATWEASARNLRSYAECWQNVSQPSYPNVGETQERSPFVFSEDINQKIYISSGDLTKMDVDAIVNPTNETMDEATPLFRALVKAGGLPFQRACKDVYPCRTGEARITDSFGIASRQVIHTVGPRFNLKYRTAAQSALFNCYRSVLQLAVEHRAPSVAIPCLHTKKRSYPPVEGTHLALRTIRRFLESHGSRIKAVVLVVDREMRQVYESILPLYFPRSLTEEAVALKKLPEDIGNEIGEPVQEERKIRISDTPRVRNISEAEDDENGYLNREDFNAKALSTLTPEFDKDRIKRAQSPRLRSADRREQIYKQWLARARKEDVSEFLGLELIRVAGTDSFGRRIVQVCGRNFKPKQMNREKLLCYFIKAMDSVVNQKYVVVYFHTATTSENHPEPSFMKMLYDIVDHRYKKNMSVCYIVHPTFWTKVMAWFFSTFTVSDIKQKIRHIDQIDQLFEHISPTQMQLPEYIAKRESQVEPMSRQRQTSVNPDDL